jgi:hypothetical protein
MGLDYGRFNKKLSSFEPAVMQHTDGDPGFLAKYKLRQELSRYGTEHETVSGVTAGEEETLDIVSLAKNWLTVRGHVVEP